jgi:hypothetical protein
MKIGDIVLLSGQYWEVVEMGRSTGYTQGKALIVSILAGEKKEIKVGDYHTAGQVFCRGKK